MGKERVKSINHSAHQDKFQTDQNLQINYKTIWKLERLFRSNLSLGVSEMAQWVKNFVKADGLSSTPGTKTLDRENQLLWVVLWPPHPCMLHAMKCTYAHIHTQDKQNFVRLKSTLKFYFVSTGWESPMFTNCALIETELSLFGTIPEERHLALLSKLHTHLPLNPSATLLGTCSQDTFAKLRCVYKAIH